MSVLSPSTNNCPARVLEAALEVFCESGYRASIDAVAKRAGVARQTIYNNFDNKEALFFAALEQAARDLFSMLDTDDGDCYSRMVQFSLQFRARVLSPEAINLHRLLVAEAPRFPELANAFFQRVIYFSRCQLAILIESAMQEGCLRREDSLEAAHFYIDLLVARDHVSLLFGAEMLDPAQEETKVKRAIELFMRAFANPEYCPPLRKDVP